MSIADALTVRLGIPAELVRDELDRGVSPAAILAPEESLLAEYTDAQGYAYDWGNVIESRSGTWLAWQFAPVELWRETDRLRRSPAQTAAALMPRLRHDVARTVLKRLPVELMLAGCHPHARIDRHVLFSLALIKSSEEPKVRRWLAAVFLPTLLPHLLERARARVVEICQSDVDPT